MNKQTSKTNTGGGEGVGVKGHYLGMVIAAIISWTTNKSILWAILHGICGWFYIVYYALVLS